MMRTAIKLLLITLLILPSIALQAQKQKNLVYIDKEGVLRYTANKKEAAFFGVNYTTPFAFAYRAQKAKQIDLEKAIQNDVYHFARLGLNAFRVHVWDNEISDTAGNLLNNDHLRLFDFLLAELKKRNIKTIITPIAFWGNGYPGPDEATPGFSRHYGKENAVRNEAAIKAQENYLGQFFKHVNPYTGLSYEDDKDIIAMEINNEPKHSGQLEITTNYINRMVAAVKATGWTKPVFYNISESPNHARAVTASKAEGYSFQWYPTGLVGNQTLKGNNLPNVDRYRIPFGDSLTAFKKKALMVYEFDAADNNNSYMYPAIARSFRKAGFQWATQFAYDPMGIAAENTEYQTHYLNLAYTPSKAISLMIAAEAFRELPRLKNFGQYPADTLFGPFRLSSSQNLSEMNSGEKFYYSNSTATQALNAKSLKKIAGVGSSPLVKYAGSGAYFLDKLEDGLWRLEVMPDAIAVQDPFEKTSPKKPVTVISWNQQAMELNLPGLGNDLYIQPLNEGNRAEGKRVSNTFTISPGSYLISSNRLQGIKKPAYLGAIKLGDFVAPSASDTMLMVLHHPAAEVTEGRAFTVSANIAGIDSGKPFLIIDRLGGGGFKRIPMQASGYVYTVEVPAEIVNPGQLQYRIVVEQKGETTAFPGGIRGELFAWDNYQNETYQTNVASGEIPVQLFKATDKVYLQPNEWNKLRTAYAGGSDNNSLSLRITGRELQAGEIAGLQFYVKDKIGERMKEAAEVKKIAIRARAENEDGLVLKISLIDSEGNAFSAQTRLDKKFTTKEILLNDFRHDSTLLLPRPYPNFQPLFFKPAAKNEKLYFSGIEKMQVTTITRTGNISPVFEVEWIKAVKED